MATDKEKKSMYMPSEVWEKAERHKKPRQSLSSFLEEAVDAYCCFLNGKEDVNILAPEISKCIRAASADTANRIVSMLFKIAGELGTINLILAAKIFPFVNERDVLSCKEKAYDSVMKNHGMISLDDALRDAKEAYENRCRE